MHDIRLLRTFLAVYRAGTFTRAARDLHLTQPAVSVQIRALEQQVGKPLFQRATTGATPTAAGRELARAIAPHVDALQSALAGASGGAHPTEATLYIGGPEEFLAERVLPVLVGDMLDGMRVRMFFDVDAPVIDRLLAGELDIAVLTYDLRRRGIESVHLCFEHLELVGTPRWRERLHALEPGAAGAEQLESVPIASYAEDLPLVDDYWQGVFGTPAKLRAAFVANGLRSCLRFAIAGAGITVLPDHTSAAALERGDLVHILDPLLPPRSPLYLAWRSGSLRRPALASVHERIVAAAVDW